MPRIASGSALRRCRREHRREAGLGPDAAEVPRRPADAPGREPRERQAGFDQAILRSEVQIHPARAATQPIPARTTAAASPAEHVVDHDAPSARKLLGRSGSARASRCRRSGRGRRRRSMRRPRPAGKRTARRAAPPRRRCSWPAISSITMQPGSSDPSARQTGPETATPTSPTTRPDINSPTTGPTLATWTWMWIVANQRARGQAMARPTSEPAVPGMTGERPEPKPVARNAASGFAANARRAFDIDTGSCRSEDPSVLIASCSASFEVYNRAERAEFFSRSRKVRTCPA